MIHYAEQFPQQEIVSTLSRHLGSSSAKNDPLKRDFNAGLLNERLAKNGNPAWAGNMLLACAGFFVVRLPTVAG